MKRLFVLLVAVLAAFLAWTRLRRAPEEDQWPEPQAGSPLGGLGGEVDPELLSILACPLDKQPVSREGHYLVCSQCGRRYPIRDGIPVMLVEEALLPDRPPATAGEESATQAAPGGGETPSRQPSGATEAVETQPSSATTSPEGSAERSENGPKQRRRGSSASTPDGENAGADS